MSTWYKNMFDTEFPDTHVYESSRRAHSEFDVPVPILREYYHMNILRISVLWTIPFFGRKRPSDRLIAVPSNLESLETHRVWLIRFW